jgi:hypothetical protein
MKGRQNDRTHHTEVAMTHQPARWLVPALIVVTASLVVAVAMLLSRPPSPSAAPAAAATSTETTEPTTTTTETLDMTLPPSAVDSVIAADGVPLHLQDDALGEPAPDAYALVKDDCDTMANPAPGQSAAEWLTGHLLNVAVPGEAKALQIGIPLVCPQFDGTLLQAQIALSGGAVPTA